MQETWNVMLVDGDRLFVAALGALLEGGPFRVTSASASYAEALGRMETGPSPDLVLVSLPPSAVRPDEAAMLARMRSRIRVGHLVVLASDMTTSALQVALMAEADACLHKGMSCEGLSRALHLVMLGEAVFPREVADLLTGAPPDNLRSEMGAEEGELSRRELEILHCLLAGQSNKAIARNLNITESTVKMHFKNVMRKIRAQNRTQAAVWAIQHGLSARLSA
jgi:two-component system, NarL family, nitrate/nitrite response regulator NarL